jgi:pimeloyl-ACP methyl ester carboxylesterase
LPADLSETAREAAERFGWIIAASENSRNGPWEPTLRAVNAMWPALLGGYAVDEHRIYTAGHSGGATVAWLIAQRTGQVAGVIASGQPNPESLFDTGKRFAWFGSAGHSDFNFLQVKSIDAQLAESKSTHRVDFFDGGHQWPPTELTFRALGWMEVVAMKEGRRARDLDPAGKVFADDVARARGLEERGLLTRSGSIVWNDRLDLLGPAGRGRRRAAPARARSRRQAQRTRALEERADRREQQVIYAVGKVVQLLSAEDAPLVAQLRSVLNLESSPCVRGEGTKRASAARSLALVRIQLSTIAREMQDRHDPRVDLAQKVLDSMK